ncbi:hypothetical protein AWB74_00832 [Caballeronia arvi]|uniref:Plasmid stabilization system protein n=1 Tax=Caballeronia arvi TaxID=1777135 RepID=A0A158FP68_9BURK|nr:hypothetical protein [Caballeronia arvi]SAL21658.1 hypothetical protein AWB74_00832 [Caballeronia arvi]
MNDGRRPADILFTEGFIDRLASIEEYWNRIGFPQGFDRLLDAIENDAIPLLQSFPAMGRRFVGALSEACESRLVNDVLPAITRADGRAQGELREYVLDDHVLLYLLTGNTVHLLSIRYDRQPSFDFHLLHSPEAEYSTG